MKFDDQIWEYSLKQVVAGDYQRLQTSGDEQTRTVATSTIHPGYNPSDPESFGYDVCVISVRERFYFGVGDVTQIRAAQLNRNANITVNTRMTVMGWGSTENILDPALRVHK
ncbi:unnamed protein product, partial [Cyprideis torosa]